MNPPGWLLEVLHQAALLPLVAVLVLRPRGPEWLLVACGLAMSWVGDSIAHYTGGSFAPSYFWLPVQIALILAAFPPDARIRVSWAVVVFVAAGGLSAASWRLTAPGPDLLVTLAGSATILAVATGDLRLPLYLYFGLGTVCYVLMVQRIGDGWLPAWWLYQGARVLTFATFLWLALGRRGRWANG